MKRVFEEIIKQLETHNLKLKSMKNMCIALSDSEVSDIENHAYNTAIKIIRNVAEKYENQYVSVCIYEQVAWERNIAIEQLYELGYEFGEKINNWTPCSSGILPKTTDLYCVTKMCENDDNPIYEVCHEIFYTRDGKWDCERDPDCEWKVIAWKNRCKPYKPEGKY